MDTRLPLHLSGLTAGPWGGLWGLGEKCCGCSSSGDFSRLGVGSVSYCDGRISVSALVCASLTLSLLGILCLLLSGISLMLVNLNTGLMQQLPGFQAQPEPLPPAVYSAEPFDHLTMPQTHLPRAELLVLAPQSSPILADVDSILPATQAKNFLFLSQDPIHERIPSAPSSK